MNRILVICTHPYQYTGYARVAFNILNAIATQHPDYAISCYGFQAAVECALNRKLPENVTLYKAVCTQNDSFGFEGIQSFVKLCQPTHILLYNDQVVVSEFLKRIHHIKPKQCTVSVYLDIVYPNTKTEDKEYIVNNSNRVITFAKCWLSELPKNDNMLHFSHGVDSSIYEIPSDEAKGILNIPKDTVVLLNANRNQPRKRYDILMQSIALHHSAVKDSKLLLLVATSANDAYNLREILQFELSNLGVNKTVDEICLFVQNPQQLSDELMNVIYNAADIGINTCDGEGFGLCNLEQASVGKPQIVPRLPIFEEIYGTSILYAEPVANYYTNRDRIGGKATACSVESYSSLITHYYENQSERVKYGKVFKQLTQHYSWDGIADVLI